jgi:hypothetical protein
VFYGDDVSAVYTVGEVLPNGAIVVNDTYATASDGSTTETMVDSLRNVTVLTVPGPGTPTANAATIAQNVAANQALILAWIAANPTGAVLTAAQTLALAKMLNGLCKLLLQQYGNTTGT